VSGLPGSDADHGSPGASRGVRIAVDAMGGEGAPGVEVEGALAAVRESGGALEVVLVGDRKVVETELESRDTAGLPVSVVNAEEVIGMHEAPAAAIRKKRRASIVVAVELHKRGEVDGVVSAGNTGAVVASSLLGLRVLGPVRRPGIASLFPTVRDPAVVIDVGASIDSRPTDLLTFAVMGEAYARHVLGRERPRVGLVNIGEESTKGSELTQSAHRLLAESPLDFVGNVEGGNLLRGEADVVVCDGFVGNVMLKLTEGIIDVLAHVVGGDLAASGLGALATQLDYAEYGGAPLLGVDGVVIIAHGSSSPKAIKNAIRVAGRFVDVGLDKVILERLQEVVGTHGR